jgi:hypothetical protein
MVRCIAKAREKPAMAGYLPRLSALLPQPQTMVSGISNTSELGKLA